MNLQERYKRPVDEFVKFALDKYKNEIEDIILFGSVARGEAKEESDIDILVITAGDRFKVRRGLSGIVMNVLLETGEYISVKTLSIKDFQFLKELKSSFVSNVIKDGESLKRSRTVT